MLAPVLSHFQARPLLEARAHGRVVASTSLDLGRTTCEVRLGQAGIDLPDGQRVPWPTLDAIVDDPVGCYATHDGGATKIQTYSEAFDRHYSLMPTAGAPTLLVSGLPMHRIKGIDPHQDTLRKMRAIAPVTGRVLDTATGLGYTAIEAAATAEQVVTIEIDPAVHDIARRNPWSQSLFDNPKIAMILGDAGEVVPGFAAESFARIMHDPPTLSLAGELYSEDMYRQLHRVLRRGRRMFHYIGNLDSPSGDRTAKGAARRLQAAGFVRVARVPDAFGLVAHKP